MERSPQYRESQVKKMINSANVLEREEEFTGSGLSVVRWLLGRKLIREMERGWSNTRQI